MDGSVNDQGFHIRWQAASVGHLPTTRIARTGSFIVFATFRIKQSELGFPALAGDVWAFKTWNVVLSHVLLIPSQELYRVYSFFLDMASKSWAWQVRVSDEGQLDIFLTLTVFKVLHKSTE